MKCFMILLNAIKNAPKCRAHATLVSGDSRHYKLQPVVLDTADHETNEFMNQRLVFDPWSKSNNRSRT